MSVDSPFVPVRRFDAASPLPEIVGGLNDWQPENLICYASMGRLLAEEQLAGRLRGVAIHPNVFHRVLEPLPVRQWQVEQQPDGLIVRLVAGQAILEPATIGAALARELTAAGSSSLPIRVELVEAVAKTALGKAPLIKALEGFSAAILPA